jgi:hypothetical protein
MLKKVCPNCRQASYSASEFGLWTGTQKEGKARLNKMGLQPHYIAKKKLMNKPLRKLNTQEKEMFEKLILDKNLTRDDLMLILKLEV